jgi:hypothetical protein
MGGKKSQSPEMKAIRLTIPRQTPQLTRHLTRTIPREQEIAMMELLERTKIRLQIEGEKEDNLLTELVNGAIELYLSLRYPTTEYPVDDDGDFVVEKKYEGWVVRAAVEMYAKIGAEGQIGHFEGGINRMYESGSLSISLLREITPVAGIAR